MAVEKRTLKLLKILLPLLIVSLIVVFLSQVRRHLRDPVENKPPPAPALETGPIEETFTITVERLQSLNREDIGQVVQSVGTTRVNLQDAIGMTAELENPPAIYLRGLLLLTDSKPEQALTAFGRVPEGEIPPSYLYPPYRLHRHLRPKEPNPFLTWLKTAISADKVSPLIQARVQAQEGELNTALSNYLKTDPAQWVRYDVECLRIIGRHEGFHSEVRRLIAGAIKSRRLSEPMARALLPIAGTGTNASDVEAFKRILREELERNGETAKIATLSAAQLLETRKLFLERKYGALLKKYQLGEPMALSTETVLLLFLSAIKEDDRLEVYRWGQEIKRRHPDRETTNWVNQLTREGS
jgi:hypothetical protein